MGEYDGAFEADTRDLVSLARDGSLVAPLFRDTTIDQAIEHLSQGWSVLLTGPAGVGKTSVVHGIAGRIAAAGLGLRELTTIGMISGTKYLGEWQTKATTVTSEAISRKNVLYFSDIWNLCDVGKTSNDKSNLLDLLRPLIQQRQLVLLGEASPEIMRKMERVPGFMALFHRVPVAPLDDAQADGILADTGERLELRLDDETRRSLMRITARFLPQRPQPGPALALLHQVASYHREKAAIGETEVLDQTFVEKVFSIYSGLPPFVVSPSATRPAGELRAWFQDRMVGQNRAIEAVVETIALFKAGLNDPSRPIGSFLFVGPTGVGKTELARALASFLFGSTTRLLRFDMSEFKDFHAFEMLMGNASRPDQPARLVDPVRAQPFQVVLFDELEKAHDNIADLFLQLLDEGQMTPPGGIPVNFRNTIVIATSNVGAQDSAKALGFGASVSAQDRRDRVTEALEGAFRPEFLNRFGHIVVFDPLSSNELRTIARMELGRILTREGITERNLIVEVDDTAIDAVIRDGVDPRYGARSLKRELQRRIVLPLAMTLMERRVDPGAILRVAEKQGSVTVRVLDTAESRTARREAEPIRLPKGRKVGRPELARGVADTLDRVEAVAAAVDEPFLLEEQRRLDVLRQQPEFWSQGRHSADALRDAERIRETLGRLTRLRDFCGQLGSALESAVSRQQLEQLGSDLVRLERNISWAELELVTLGSDGAWDAILEVRPVPGGTPLLARDFLVGMYRDWATGRGMTVDWILEPMSDAEPAVLAIKGHYASGLLEAEAGLHRVRDTDNHGACRVRVIPMTDQEEAPEFGPHRAIKGSGQYGGKIRSRVTCGSLVLQNSLTLAQNRELAAELYGAWSDAPESPEAVVRRIDLRPFKVRDERMGTLGRPSALSPDGLHTLLADRARA